MRENAPIRWFVTAGALSLPLGVGVVCYYQASRLDFDFNHFYRDARYMWDHAALNPDLDGPDPLQRRQLPFYLPAVPLALAPMTAGGVRSASAIWAAVSAAVTLVVLGVLSRWAQASAPQRHREILIVIGLAALPAFYEVARFSQISFVVLALALLGAWALIEDRPKTCGLLFGLATVLKLLPAVLLIWLALKRRWTAFACGLVCTILAALVPCLIAFGPARTVQYHKEWVQKNLAGNPIWSNSTRQPREHFIDHRNQSISAVVGRVLWKDHPAKAPWQPMSLGNRASAIIASTVWASLAAILLVATRRRWAAIGSADRRREFAAYLIAMTVFSPLLREYYLVWCLPALVELGVRAASEASARERTIGWSGILIWLAGMAAWLSPAARLYGAHLLMLVCIAALVLLRSREPSSESSTGSKRGVTRMPDDELPRADKSPVPRADT